MLWGIIVIICAFTVTTGSSWVSYLISDEDGNDSEEVVFADKMSSLGKIFEIFLYIFGVYTLVQGFNASFCCSGKCRGSFCSVTAF
jgi:hypothetical protein